MSDEHHQYGVCMWHGAHSEKISRLRKDLDQMEKTIKKQDERLDGLTVEFAKMTGKMVAGVAIAQALLQVALKALG